MSPITSFTASLGPGADRTIAAAQHQEPPAGGSHPLGGSAIRLAPRLACDLVLLEQPASHDHLLDFRGAFADE